ncbi:serine protease [Pseudonocardiaceae bacterium YIM PH 21723]|nr:serine protease [Pseudonocardiaceae bacterium YIM PH 21723]
MGLQKAGLLGVATGVVAALVLLALPDGGSQQAVKYNPLGSTSVVKGISPAAAQQYIVGGTQATQTYSFMASLQSRGQHVCGGALVAPTWIVTAKHCTTGAGVTKARVGTLTNNAGGELLTVKRSVKGPNDIAMLELATPAKSTPIKVADQPPAVGTATRLIGWGQTCPNPNCGQAPTQLQEIDTKVVDTGCTAQGFDGTKELCIESPGGNGACYGDSGGPALVQTGGVFELVGATSRAGADQETCGLAPAIYESVPAFNDFVNKNLASTPSTTTASSEIPTTEPTVGDDGRTQVPPLPDNGQIPTSGLDNLLTPENIALIQTLITAIAQQAANR